MLNKAFEETLAGFFRSLSQPVRLEILLAIGTGEACVCHLEAAIGQRQAYISQQLMALREAGIVESRREGRNVYYRVNNHQVLDLIRTAAEISSQERGAIQITGPANLQGECPCPRCGAEEPEIVPLEKIQVGSAHSLPNEDIPHD
jgi:DNA-binding transcriptional ArsR family regulator